MYICLYSIVTQIKIPHVTEMNAIDLSGLYLFFFAQSNSKCPNGNLSNSTNAKQNSTYSPYIHKYNSAGQSCLLILNSSHPHHTVCPLLQYGKLSFCMSEPSLEIFCRSPITSTHPAFIVSKRDV